MTLFFYVGCGRIECSVESSQIARGFELVHRQVESKYEQHLSAYRRLGDVVLRFESLTPNIRLNLSNSIAAVDSVSEDQVRGSDLGVDRNGLVDGLQKVSTELAQYFGDDGILASQRQSAKSPPDQGQTVTLLDQVVSVYERITCSNRKKVNRAAVGGTESWVITSTSPSSDGVSVDDVPHIELCLPQEVDVSAISIQGGLIPSELQRQPSTQSPTQAITLPCGLQLKDCDGSMQHTVDALGSVIDWEELIKKSSPEKFLKRPPVRFLFDLINLVAAKGGLNVFTAEPDWDATSQSKQNKIAFMETVSRVMILMLIA